MYKIYQFIVIYRILHNIPQIYKYKQYSLLLIQLFPHYPQQQQPQYKNIYIISLKQHMKNSPKILNKQNIPYKQKQQRSSSQLQSQTVPISNPINDKILKFGKSIRARLSQKTDIIQSNVNGRNSMIRSSQPLYDNTISRNNRQSQNLQSIQYKNSNSSSNRVMGIQDISINSLNSMSMMSMSSMMSNSYTDLRNKNKNKQQDYQSNINIIKSNFSKNKSVKFIDSQHNQSSTSLSKQSKKNHSILKNSNSSDKLSSGSVTSHIGTYNSISGGLSIKASLKDKGIDCQNKKYQSTIKILTAQNKKYFDDMFPPGSASLFYSKNLTTSKKDIRWMRLQDIYRGHKLILYSHKDRNIVKNGQFPQLNYMPTCLNALGTSQRCLQRIFENQQYSRLGIYYLRLNHQGIWKYIIVDDFIPVRQKGKSYQPVFLNVQATKSNYIEIWPLLLQKAMAKIYSTYQCLFNQNVINCMQELTGVICEKIQLNFQNLETNQLKIKSYLMCKDNIFMVSQPNQPKIYPLQSYAINQVKQESNTYFSSQLQFKLISTIPTLQNPLNNSNIHSQNKLLTSQLNQPQTLQSLTKHFKSLQIYVIDDSHYSVGCVIKQQTGTFSLRTFKVQYTGRCVLSVIQKDKKYYRNNGYQYSWMRIILVQKDIDGYRYINAAYNNTKIVHIDCILNPGQYYILLNGDWNNKKVYDVTLNYQGVIQTQIKRQPISKYPNIIIQCCRDIAQRFGSFVQINKNVCSYQYCDKFNGFIIQNFNNQMDRQVYFHRNYWINTGLMSFVSLGNAKFVQQDKQKQKDKKGKSRYYQIQTFLEPDANITMVLMTVGGRYQKGLNQFKFQ